VTKHLSNFHNSKLSNQLTKIKYNFIQLTIFYFSFESGNGIQRSESGRLLNGAEQSVQGQWEYVDPDGKVTKITVQCQGVCRS
jgi:Insect cuticle protein